MDAFLAGSTDALIAPAPRPETATRRGAFARLLTSLVHATAQTIPSRETDDLTREWFRYPLP